MRGCIIRVGLPVPSDGARNWADKWISHAAHLAPDLFGRIGNAPVIEALPTQFADARARVVAGDECGLEFLPEILDGDPLQVIDHTDFLDMLEAELTRLGVPTRAPEQTPDPDAPY